MRNGCRRAFLVHFPDHILNPFNPFLTSPGQPLHSQFLWKWQICFEMQERCLHQVLHWRIVHQPSAQGHHSRHSESNLCGLWQDHRNQAWIWSWWPSNRLRDVCYCLGEWWRTLSSQRWGRTGRHHKWRPSQTSHQPDTSEERSKPNFHSSSSRTTYYSLSRSFLQNCSAWSAIPAIC